MQENFPSTREELLLFKTSISFIDHIQEFLSAILTASVLVTPPMKELKENLCSVVNFIQVGSVGTLLVLGSTFYIRMFHVGSVHSAFATLYS